LLRRRADASPVDLDPIGNPAGHVPWRGVVPSGSVNWFNPTGGAGLIRPELIRTLRFERADVDGLREAQEVQFAWSDSTRASVQSAKSGAELAQGRAGAGCGTMAGK
jgi:cold shock CspA family protein